MLITIRCRDTEASCQSQVYWQLSMVNQVKRFITYKTSPTNVQMYGAPMNASTHSKIPCAMWTLLEKHTTNAAVVVTSRRMMVKLSTSLKGTCQPPFFGSCKLFDRPFPHIPPLPRLHIPRRSLPIDHCCRESTDCDTEECQ